MKLACTFAFSVLLTGCASLGTPGPITVAALPRRFDYACTTTNDTLRSRPRGHLRISVDLDQGLWIEDGYHDPSPIASIEPTQIVFDDVLEAWGWRRTAVQIATGAYSQKNGDFGDLPLNYVYSGRCVVRPFSGLRRDD